MIRFGILSCCLVFAACAVKKTAGDGSLLADRNPAAAAPRFVDLCPGQGADASGVVPADAALQACINQTPPGGTLSLPPGTFLLGSMIEITNPITILTAGTASQGSCYEGIYYRAGVTCTILKAASSYAQPSTGRGFIHVHNTTGVHLSHLIIDGNIEGRAAANNVIGPCQTNVPCPNVVFDACNTGTYDDPLTQTHLAIGDGTPAQACSFDNGAAINAIGMGAIVVKRSLSFNLNNSNIMYNGRFLRKVAGDEDGGSDGLTTEDHVDGLQVVNNQFIDNSDGGISINGGVKNGYIAYNQILQYNETVGNGIVVARLPYDVLDNANLSGTIVEYNNIDGCTTDNCRAADRYGCDHAQNSYMQVGIFLGSDGWAHVGNVQAPIGGFIVRNNHIQRVSRGIQLAGVGRADAPTTITGNEIHSLRVLPDATFHDCHMTPGHDARYGAGIAWCQNAAPGQCDTSGRANGSGAAAAQDFSSVNGLTDGNKFFDGAGLNASLDYFSGY